MSAQVWHFSHRPILLHCKKQPACKKESQFLPIHLQNAPWDWECPRLAEIFSIVNDRQSHDSEHFIKSEHVHMIDLVITFHADGLKRRRRCTKKNKYSITSGLISQYHDF